MNIPFEWEIINDTACSDDMHWEATYRAKVIGGWLIRYECNYDSDERLETQENYNTMTNQMIFVPDINHDWEIERE